MFALSTTNIDQNSKDQSKVALDSKKKAETSKSPFGMTKFGGKKSEEEKKIPSTEKVERKDSELTTSKELSQELKESSQIPPNPAPTEPEKPKPPPPAPVQEKPKEEIKKREFFTFSPKANFAEYLKDQVYPELEEALTKVSHHLLLLIPFPAY